MLFVKKIHQLTTVVRLRLIKTIKPVAKAKNLGDDISQTVNSS